MKSKFIGHDVDYVVEKITKHKQNKINRHQEIVTIILH